MEAKKMARKIEEHFFTKRNRVNLNFKCELNWICNNLDIQGQITNDMLSIKKIDKILTKLGICNVQYLKVIENGNTTISYIIDKKEYNKIKKFLIEYRKLVKFSKEIKLENKYPIDVIIDYMADGIFVRY